MELIHNLGPPGRFLEEVNSQQERRRGCWVEIDKDRARKKTGQVLRESTPLEKNLISKSSREIDDTLLTTMIHSVPCSTPTLLVEQQRQLLTCTNNLFLNNVVVAYHNSNFTYFTRRSGTIVSISTTTRPLSIGDQRRKKYHTMKMEESFWSPRPFSRS